jgi:tetratricopeptide (TPR) repeat protein
LDIEVFETAITQVRDIPGQALTSEQASQLDEAVKHYNGDLLEDIYEDWCLYERERLRRLYLNTLSKLMIYHQTNGSLERSLGYGHRILALDPTSEKIHRRIMRLYWRLDARDKALAQYERCVQLLRDELGVAPMDETKRLYEWMVHNDYDPFSLPIKHDSAVFHILQSNDGSEPLPDHALQQLHRLHRSIEKTRVELRQMEDLLATVLFHSNHSQISLERSAKVNAESKIGKLFLNAT